MSISALPHQFTVDVAPDDIDFMGHVNNASYLKWVQAAVIDHWRHLAPAEAVAQHLWVALKHEITYRRPPSSTTMSSRRCCSRRSRARAPSTRR